MPNLIKTVEELVRRTTRALPTAKDFPQMVQVPGEVFGQEDNSYTGDAGYFTTANLISFWSLDFETYSGGVFQDQFDSNNFTPSGTWSHSNIGVIRDCVLLAGTGSSLTKASNASLQSADFSMEFWMKPSSVTGTQRVVHKTYEGNHGWAIYLDGTTLGFRTFNSTGGVGATVTTGPYAIGTWYHVIATYNSATKVLILWRNALSNQVIDTSDFDNTLNTNPLTLGDAITDGYSGRPDEVRFYDDVLTATEVRRHMWVRNYMMWGDFLWGEQFWL